MENDKAPEPLLGRFAVLFLPLVSLSNHALFSFRVCGAACYEPNLGALANSLPRIVFRNGQYQLFFCQSDRSEDLFVSDHPAGPPRCHAFAVFIDDDGQAYLKNSFALLDFNPSKSRSKHDADYEPFLTGYY